MNTLARQLQEQRADLHLTVDELAVLCELPPDVVWRILETPGPDPRNRPGDARST